jgi:predicted acylesterase/phospholipase RssA
MSADSTKSRTVFFQSCLGVFQGGGCRGAAFAGAVAESIDWGVDFAGLAGTSAGSVVAAILGAGASPEELVDIVTRLDFPSLLVAPEQMASKK